MSGDRPAVSVVMSVLDGEAYVRDAIDSVVAQTFREWELVVVDDGSTDATGEILDDYASREPRIVVLHRANEGRPSALNAAVRHAQAPLLARLDADDVALPRRLELQLARLAAEPDVGVLGGAVVFVDAAGRQFAQAHYPLDDEAIRSAAASSTTPFVHSAVTMRRAAFERAGGYRPAFVDAEDLDLWLRIPPEFRLANLEEPVVRYRLHGAQASMTHLRRQATAAAAARVSARARQAGSDPFAGAASLEPRALRAAGVTEEAVAEELVRMAVWLGKTFGRAGDRTACERLFATAAAEAGDDPALSAYVAEQRERRRAEEHAHGVRPGAGLRGLLRRLLRRRPSDAR